MSQNLVGRQYKPGNRLKEARQKKKQQQHLRRLKDQAKLWEEQMNEGRIPPEVYAQFMQQLNQNKFNP